MAVFDSIGDLFKGNINDLIDQAEDPKKMVKQIIVELEEHLDKATQSLVSALAGRNEISKQFSDAKAQSEKWQEKVKQCFQAGNEDLAKQALENKIKQDHLAEQYSSIVASMDAQIGELHSRTAALRKNLEAARLKQSTLNLRSE